MIEILAIALGAAIGAPSRFILDRWMVGHAPTKRFPWSLLLVNVLGSALAGAAFAVTTGNLRVFLLVGLCGSLTTFSGFGWEMHQLWARSRSTFVIALLVMTAACIAAFLVFYLALRN
ncbi:MAG: fluoride efflux transporter FluC [Candidatus Nanopelagicales bacterium]